MIQRTATPPARTMTRTVTPRERFVVRRVKDNADGSALFELAP